MKHVLLSSGPHQHYNQLCLQKAVIHGCTVYFSVSANSTIGHFTQYRSITCSVLCMPPTEFEFCLGNMFVSYIICVCDVCISVQTFTFAPLKIY